MKTVLLLGGPADGQRVEVHGAMRTWCHEDRVYWVVPMCSHGEVHWFGVLDGADPLALLIAGYGGGRLAELQGLLARRDALLTETEKELSEYQHEFSGDVQLEPGEYLGPPRQKTYDERLAEAESALAPKGL